MKISRTSLILIYAAVILFAGAFYSAELGHQIRNDEEIKRKAKARMQSEEVGKLQFGFSDNYEDNTNFADNIATGLFMLAASTALAAIWTRKLND